MKSDILKRLAMNVICTLLTVSLILLTCACSMKKRPPATALEVLTAMLNATTPSEGRIRTLTAETETQRLPTELLTALYGSTAEKWFEAGEGSLIDDGAVYLSEVMHPFEMAVFRCIDQGDVSGGMASILGVCASRLEIIKAAWQGSDYDTFVQNATVTYCGSYVILVVAEDPEPIIKAAKKVIKQS